MKDRVIVSIVLKRIKEKENESHYKWSDIYEEYYRNFEEVLSKAE